MVMTSSVNIEVWMKELRDRARLDSIESGPVKWNPEDQDIRKRTRALKGERRPSESKNYLGQYPSGAASSSS